MLAMWYSSVRDLDAVFAELAGSDFRKKIHLNRQDAEYMRQKGFTAIAEHAGRFIAGRLAPAEPKNDGKQTPYRGHPVFVAQHATATCCRSCLQRWHQISKGRDLTDEEHGYVVDVLCRWIEREVAGGAAPPTRGE